MKLSGKFNIYILILTAVIIAALAVSYNSIRLLGKETSGLFDLSIQKDYITNLRNTLVNTEHSIEHYLHIRPGDEYRFTVERDLSELERVLRFSANVTLDEGEKQIIKFSLDNFDEFSAMVHGLIQENHEADRRKKEAYAGWRKNYIQKILSEIDDHWKQDLEKITKMSKDARTIKERALRILLVTALMIFLLIIFSRMIISRAIVRPLKTIEDVSNAIAGGEAWKRTDIRSGDELGSLSRSVNIMAGVIEDKLNRLKDSIAKEQAVVREQTILNELMGFIASGIDLEKVLRTFLERTRDLIKAKHSSIFILENAGDNPELKIFVNTFEEKTSQDCARSMLNGVFRNSVRTLTPLRVNTAMGEAPATHLEISNMLAIPILSINKKSIGLIVLVNKEGGFTQDDEDTLFSFSFQAFQAISMQQEILRYATTDGLTGLHNHRVFMERLAEEIERAKRYSQSFTLLMVDIDHFKSFNDIYGHQAGDHILKSVADLINESIRNTDFGARYGGEEFAVILPETTGPQVLVVAERLRNSINRYEFVLENGEPAHVTVSIGYSTYPDDADNADALLRSADQGLYFAKESGRNRVRSYYDASRKIGDRTPDEIENMLRNSSLTSFKELAKAIDSKSYYMKGHSLEVAAIAVMIGKKLGLGDDQIEGLRIASLLHDVGNLSIPDYILNKTGPLTDEEKRIIQGHPGLSEILLRHYAQSEIILPAILYHHERFDGKGYPLGLKGDDIPFQAKILGAVEAYHAMISERPYRRGMNRTEAISVIEGEAGNQFDPMIAKMLVNLLKDSEDPHERRRDRD